MAGRQLKFEDDARAALMAGVDAVADAVRVTLGPNGRYVIVDRSRDPQSTDPGGLTVTNDGVTVARELEIADQFENQGGRLVREVARVAEELAGDGSTTAVLLAQEMLRGGLRNVAAGAHPIAVRNGIERAVAQAVDHLIGEQAIGIGGRSQIAVVTAVAAGDEAIGAMVADAFDAVGADGVVDVTRNYGDDQLELEMTEGMWFYNGYLSPHMITDQERGEAVLENPYILIANQEVTRAEQLVPVLDQVAPTGRPLLVIADKVTGSALAVLVANQDKLRSVAVKARYLGHHRRRHLEEVALFTGGESIADKLDVKQPLGMTVEATQLSQLGRARRVTVTRNTTTIVDGAGDEAAIATRIAQLRREIEEGESTWDRERTEERLNHLAGVIAMIKVGAATEIEVRELMPRIEDAVRAASAALAEGIVPGGGVAHLDAAKAIDVGGLSADEAVGAEVVRRALCEPARQIADNAGFDGSLAVERASALPAGDGLDVRNGEYGDVIDSGVLDPTLVARVTLQAAASVAKVVLSTEAAAVDSVRELPPMRDDAPAYVPPKHLAYDAGARHALASGVDSVARAVAVTLGPSGRNVALASSLRDPGGSADGRPASQQRVVITNDGVTIARQIAVQDPFEAFGARLCQEVAGATNDATGDGTTTATVLAREIVSAGQRNAVAGADPLALRRGIEQAVEQAVAHLGRQSIDVARDKHLARVAASAADDDRIGDVVAEAFERAGGDGVVSFEEGHTLDIELDVAPGMQWGRGYLAPEMATDPGLRKAVLEHPHVLCVEERIGSAEELGPVLDQVVETGRPLLLVVGALDEEPRRMLVANKLNGRLSAVAVTAPDFLEQRRRNLEDIAILTGGQAITEELGRGLLGVGLDQLGGARRVVVTQGATTIVDGAGARAQIEARIAELRTEIERVGSARTLRDQLRSRLARLAGAVATIKVGAATGAEAKERLLRVEDAVQAARVALEEGLVPGGGVALFRAAGAISVGALGRDEAVGAEIVRRALEEPLRRIAENAGLEGSVVVERARSLGPREGLDAATGEWCDLVAAGIVDPTMVVRSALEHAASIAKTVLIVECVAAERPVL